MSEASFGTASVFFAATSEGWSWTRRGQGTKAYTPGRGQQGQVCLTLLVFTTVLLKRDLKGQDPEGDSGPGPSRAGRGPQAQEAQAPDPAGRDRDGDPMPTGLPLLPLTSFVTACTEGLRMGCVSVPC